MFRVSNVTPCEFKFSKKNGKMYCKTHKCSLLYVYRLPDLQLTYRITCQAFEDLLAEEISTFSSRKEKKV